MDGERSKRRPMSPHGRNEAVDAMLSELARELGDAFVGALVTGSVADGTATTASDIDMCVLWSHERMERRRAWFGEIEFDLFLDHPDAIRRAIEERRSAFLVDMYAKARPVHDRHGTGARLVAAAGAALAQGFSPPSPQRAFRQYCEITDAVRALLAAEDHIAFAYLAGAFVHTAVEALWSRHRSWGAPRKRALAQLAAEHPDVHAIIVRLLAPETELKRRKACAVALAEAVLGPLPHLGARLAD
jgi:predicted nucleotidyltransferase